MYGKTVLREASLQVLGVQGETDGNHIAKDSGQAAELNLADIVWDELRSLDAL